MTNTVFFEGLEESTVAYLQRLLCYLQSVDELPTASDSYWIVYGSIAINGLAVKSDVDLLLVTKHGNFNPYRVQETFKGRPITIYVLAETDVLADGHEQTYGGYFTGKLLSPFIIQGGEAHTLDRIYASIHAFINALSLEAIPPNTAPDQLIHEYITRYLHVCPWYKSYVLKFIQTLGLEPARLLLQRHYAQIHNTKLDRAKQYIDHEEQYRHRLRLVARFWSYGAIEHKNDFRFSDYYFDKAEQTALAIDPDGLIWNEFCKRSGIS